MPKQRKRVLTLTPVAETLDVALDAFLAATPAPGRKFREERLKVLYRIHQDSSLFWRGREMTRQDVDQWAYACRESLSPGSTPMHIETLKAFMAFLTRRYGLPLNLGSHLQAGRRPRRLKQYLSEDQVDALILGLANRIQACYLDPDGRTNRRSVPILVRDLTMILLVLDTGARFPQIITARIQDFNAQEACISLAPRHMGGNPVPYYLLEETVELLRDYIDYWLRPTLGATYWAWPLFMNEYGEPLALKSIQANLAKHGKEYLGQSLSATLLEDTAIMLKLRDGVEPLVVKLLTGIRDDRTIKRYVGSLPPEEPIRHRLWSHKGA